MTDGADEDPLPALFFAVLFFADADFPADDAGRPLLFPPDADDVFFCAAADPLFFLLESTIASPLRNNRNNTEKDCSQIRRRPFHKHAVTKRSLVTKRKNPIALSKNLIYFITSEQPLSAHVCAKNSPGNPEGFPGGGLSSAAGCYSAGLKSFSNSLTASRRTVAE